MVHWSGDGRDRVAIARALGIRDVPVTVRTVDAAWWRREAAFDGDAAAALRAHLETLAPIAGAPTRAPAWREEVGASSSSPLVRPNPDGMNAAIDAAVRIERHVGRMEALERWDRIGPVDAVPAFVNVMAARVAHRAGRAGDARRRVDEVLRHAPAHVAAGELARHLG